MESDVVAIRGDSMARLSDVSRVRRCLEHAKQAINKKEFYPRGNVQLDLVLLALISKSIITSEAVCILVASGHLEEAFGLTRTLVDLYFTVRYISNKDSLDRAERFATRSSMKNRLPPPSEHTRASK